MAGKVSITVPTGLDIVIDPDKVFRAAGNAGAKQKREDLRLGRGGKGIIPMPSDVANAPLNRTGKLIDSVQYMPKRVKNNKGKLVRAKYQGGHIYPRGERLRENVKSPKTARRNMAILMILNHTSEQIKAADPLGLSESLNAHMMAAARKNIKNQKVKLSNRGKKRL